MYIVNLKGQKLQKKKVTFLFIVQKHKICNFHVMNSVNELALIFF